MSNHPFDEKPFKVEQRGTYWMVVRRDDVFGTPMSYPARKRVADAECATLNRAYAEAIAEAL
jgi:hypothetical protein